MSKDIENITEELMMRYVEGDLDHEESKKFQEILSQNEYLSKRTNILKTISENRPVKSPSRKVHHQILSGIGISSNDDISFIKRYIDFFMSIFDKRPMLAGSFLSIFVAALLSSVIIYNNIDPQSTDHRHITNKESIDENKGENSEDDYSRN